MLNNPDTEAWLKSGKHLPPILRDFDFQRDTFRAMHELVEDPNPNDPVKRPSWIEGHCYVIDVFLWFMARRGYTLQKTRRPGSYRDLKSDVQAQKVARDAAMSESLRLSGSQWS